MAKPGQPAPIEREVARLFALVSEALAAATDALLGGEPSEASRVVESDRSVDALTDELTRRIWEDLDDLLPPNEQTRQLIGLLTILPELERSADLAEHIAQRGVSQLGRDMPPVTRGIVQRMSDVALEMWHEAAGSYVRATDAGDSLNQADEELDILTRRLTDEVSSSQLVPSIAAQVTLLGRFYERLGDHAVNLARRAEGLRGGPPVSGR
ncbi:MAG TPA: PhoU domain-containing protein [Acidimicrobiales bacterium]|nr:PhoU domain-containing protein [Acidimicrobiales bacterium]